MALPLPRVVADTGHGGNIVTSMKGINSLNNEMLLRKINQIKAQYAPLTTQAEAASKLAYANLMGPQFLAKLLGNDSALANLSEGQKRNILNSVYQAGSGAGTAANIFSNLQQPTTGRRTNPLSQWFSDKVKDVFGQQGQRSPIEQMPPDTQVPENTMRPSGGVTLEGEQWYNSKGEPVYEENVDTPEGSMKLELTKGQRPKTYAENTGEYKGTVKQGEELGKHRAQALQDIGDSQLSLSHSGAVLDRMTNIIKNPVFQNMRNKIPFFQDKQLNYLMKTGTPEEKKLIGDFMTTAENFIASTVQSFGGRPLVREFDLAQRQKITPSDPVHVAEGKLRASIALHDIAEKKNNIISDLLNQGMNLSDAVKQANKMVDVSAIDKQTDELLRDKPTDEDIAYMAKKHNISPEEVRKQLKARGIM
ncbi:TPA: hypothetical protein ACPSKZ_000685 [Legionella anisa]|uniref:hypothetical protein n=1 Tax=Legionella anisa TaxID=28082 RepID=UPI0022440896|nr:hypothetical protein [Legionella anisa]MCW8425617.1 hypothetical protein [Legionella anisa]MCW8448954.1 hypothetical protein [Legionella anisa]